MAPWLLGTAKLPDDVVNGYKWELYNLTEDYSENNDLAAKMPDKLHEMQELFLVEAAKYNVFPLDNSVLTRLFVSSASVWIVPLIASALLGPVTASPRRPR